ncbi:DUF4367 domain-containing protein [Mesobacillus jeotgali]|uniref:DUF4367 domain-containing protein n=1 Tax=Mesobacillus jeotgali TaxID=129985 RepID=UPI001CFF2917|nr:DUF4367 domain-containing protein [Mesobacillus jeotgali]
MEDQLNQMKNQMLKGELADFEFTPKMKQGVLRKMNHKRSFSILGLVPAGLSFIFAGVFIAGIYFLVDSNYTNQPGPASPPGSATHDQDEKPELIPPGYIPEPYVFKHTHTDGDIYEHVYVHPEDENENFTYGISSRELQLEEGSAQEFQLTADIKGSFVEVGEGHSYVKWEDEGFNQVVEQKGSMNRIDLLKIVDSILVKKGHDSLLAGEIEKLEEAAAPPAEEQTVNEELTEEAAIGMLVKYEEKTRSVNSDRDNLKYNNHHTKEEYYQSFLDLMTREAAAELFEYRLEEKDGGLYAIPTEFPVFYSEVDPHTFEKVDENQYVLSQTFKEGLYSGLTATFTYTGQKWLISDIEAK